MEASPIKDSPTALFEVKLDLSEDTLVYSPSLLDGTGSGFLELVFDLMHDICAVAELFPRIAQPLPIQPDKATYTSTVKQIIDCPEIHTPIPHPILYHSEDVKKHLEINAIRSDIISNVRSTSLEAQKYMKKFHSYDYIWLEDKNIYLEKFLNDELKRRENEDDIDESEKRGGGSLNVYHNLNLGKFRKQVGFF